MECRFARGCTSGCLSLAPKPISDRWHAVSQIYSMRTWIFQPFLVLRVLQETQLTGMAQHADRCNFPEPGQNAIDAPMQQENHRELHLLVFCVEVRLLASASFYVGPPPPCAPISHHSCFIIGLPLGLWSGGVLINCTRVCLSKLKGMQHAEANKIPSNLQNFSQGVRTRGR